MARKTGSLPNKGLNFNIIRLSLIRIFRIITLFKFGSAQMDLPSRLVYLHYFSDYTSSNYLLSRKELEVTASIILSCLDYTKDLLFQNHPT